MTIDPYVYLRTFTGAAPYNDAGTSVAVDRSQSNDCAVVVGAI